MENKDYLTDEEMEVLSRLGFSEFIKNLVIKFVEDIIKNKNLQEMHNLGVSRRSLIKILKKIDPDNSFIKKNKKISEVEEEEVLEMLNLKQ